MKVLIQTNKIFEKGSSEVKLLPKLLSFNYEEVCSTINVVPMIGNMITEERLNSMKINLLIDLGNMARKLDFSTSEFPEDYLFIQKDYSNDFKRFNFDKALSDNDLEGITSFVDWCSDLIGDDSFIVKYPGLVQFYNCAEVLFSSKFDNEIERRINRVMDYIAINRCNFPNGFIQDARYECLNLSDLDHYLT